LSAQADKSVNYLLPRLLFSSYINVFISQNSTKGRNVLMRFASNTVEWYNQNRRESE